MKKIHTSLIIFNILTCILFAKGKTNNIIFITFDGLRWEEVFYGADSILIHSDDYTKNQKQMLKDYWHSSDLIRREQLMPFFWNTIINQGQLYGNIRSGSITSLENPYRFSYPGYSEMLVGYVDLSRNSNNKENNPNITVLEYIHNQPGYKNKVAAFCSWDVFDFIINEERSGIYVSAGMETYDRGRNNPKIGLLNEIMLQIPVPWRSVRYDAITHNFAKTYLEEMRPKLLYIAYDETDEYAHEGKYDKYLNAANQLDQYVSDLWNWVQSNYYYKNKTTILITTDHGRGNKDIDSWRNHGSSVNGAEHVWMAVIGPDTPPKGEMTNHEKIYSSQIASTIASFLGIEYQNERTVAPMIKTMFYD